MPTKSKYRCVAQSTEAVVQLIAASYLRHGYYWYVTGQIPERKNPESIDVKLIDKYGIDISTWQRSQRRKQGVANAQYLRHGRWFILMLTAGHHALRQPSSKGGEGERVMDCRRVPIRFAGYSISYRKSGVAETGGGPPKWHAHVRIDAPTYAQLKAHFEGLATHRTADTLAAEFTRLPFARYAPIRRQLLNLLRLVNGRRKPHGYETLPYSVLNLRRVPVSVYEEPVVQADEGSTGEVNGFSRNHGRS
ncbi:hypothetical protein Q31b_43030 [Novipirellula aureliae]|uniref:Uncharacterized protein n=1 Tax=Novipirellula aureliae TaxID=2527966 RepID=A0A5C6DMX9_9BACT|nr:hypothetical protein [Novipirellula aureliae]TWU37515.1 hypothetical protein Q31b_43030 [Novipirellula aureliae]